MAIWRDPSRQLPRATGFNLGNFSRLNITMLGGLCLSGCCDAIGFDGLSWDWLNPSFLFRNVRYITNIAGAVNEKLTPTVKLLLAGNNNQCGNAIRFAESEWPAIKSWLQAGGKMFIAAEHSGNYPDNNLSIKCLQDMDNLNDFLEFMDVDITYIGNDCNADFPDTGFYIPDEAQVAQGVTDFGGGRFGELDGGTTVFTGYAGLPDIPPGKKNGLGLTACVADRIGHGFIFAIGDSDCGRVSTSHKFIRKIYDANEADML